MDVSSAAVRLLFTTIKIESYNPKSGYCAGTGFFFSLIHRQGSETTGVDFIVTNRHVVENGIEGRLSFLKGTDENKPLFGERVKFDFTEKFSEAWYFNKDKKTDIAILPVTDLFLFFGYRGERIFHYSITNENILTENSLNEIDALEEVVFIGYPFGLWDEKNFLPIFRKGITASPITVDFNGEKQFLIDASVYEGSSGSPVFLFNQGIYTHKTGELKMGTRLNFLGILSKGYDVPVVGSMEDIKEQDKKFSRKKVPITEQALDIGVVFKASTIVDTIKEFLPHYQEWRESRFEKESKSKV